MDVSDLIQHIEFNSFSSTLESLKGYHLKASRNGTLNETCPVRIFMTTGRVVEGFIVDYKHEFNNLVIIEKENVARQELKVILVSASNIEGIELAQFEKVYQLFSDNEILEGLGESPNLLSLRKDFERVTKLFENSVFNSVDIDIAFEEFREGDKGSWALKQVINTFESFIDRNEIDDDFKSAFNDAISKISVTKGEVRNLFLDDRTLHINVDISKGIQGSPSSNELYDFLYGKL